MIRPAINGDSRDRGGYILSGTGRKGQESEGGQDRTYKMMEEMRKEAAEEKSKEISQASSFDLVRRKLVGVR